MANDAVEIDASYETEPFDSHSVDGIFEAEREILRAIGENTGKTGLEPAGKIQNVRYLEKEGELFINPFDFFQQLQRWMYEAGMFNRFR